MQAASQHPDSWWAATCGPVHFPRLGTDIETDVAIIGAGFTGLSAAHHLKQRGYRCAVLEARQVGWGASGRNGGMAVPRYKLTWPELERKYGLPHALRLYALAHEGVDTLQAIVKQQEIDCDFARHGHVTPIAGAVHKARFEEDLVWLKQHLGDHVPGMLGSQGVAQRTGSDAYDDGYFEPRGAGLHPLRYCTGLASALARQGVNIHCDSPVLGWHSERDKVELVLANARVRARSLVVACNAYADSSAAGATLKKRVVPTASAVIVTEPLPATLARLILPQRNLATDAKRLTNYYRVLPDGSLFFGGRGGAGVRAGERIYRQLHSEMLQLFPALDGIALRYRWYGLVAVTLDSLPHIGRLHPNVHYAMGYNGRGVALSAALGKYLARQVAGEPASLGPVSDARFSAIPLHALRRPAKQAVMLYHQLRDRWR